MLEKRLIAYLFPIGGGYGHLCAACAATARDVELYESKHPILGYCDGCSDVAAPESAKEGE